MPIVGEQVFLYSNYLIAAEIRKFSMRIFLVTVVTRPNKSFEELTVFR